MANRPAPINIPVERPVAARLLTNSGALLILAAGSFVIAHYTSPGANGRASAALAAFVLFLLGASMVKLALVADQFPGAARVGVAIARVLNCCLFGGGGGN